MKKPLLSYTKKGLYCEKGNFYIDPQKPVDYAIISHGHADHARNGHLNYLCHHDTKAILYLRLGAKINIESVEYGERFKRNGVEISLLPAGHILGSAQISVSYKGEKWVVSGDYKTDKDPIAVDFEPVKCHTFITECTFGLPIYRWKEEALVINEIESWWKENQNKSKISVISAYSLGKAQRLLALIDPTIGRIYCHGAVHKMNNIFKNLGKLKNDFHHLTLSEKKDELIGGLIVAPPSSLNSGWANKLEPISIGIASGWMTIRGAKRRQNVDRGFVLSDHADWKGLNQAIKLTGAEKYYLYTWIHRYFSKMAFSEWL